MEEVHTIVIGAGISGLCAADYLGKRHGNDAVLVLESSDYVGGHVRTDRVDGFCCDWGPNGFLDREPLTLEWVRDLGLQDRVVRANEAAAHRFIFKNNQLIEIKPPPAFLVSPILSPMGRARLLCEPLMATRRDGAPESIWDFAARRIGREAADMMVSPMVTGIFGGDAKQLSLAHCFPRMRAMEVEHGSLFNALRAKRKQNASASAMGPGGTLTSFDRGAAVLAEAVADRLAGRIRTGVTIQSLTQSASSYRVTTGNGYGFESKNVILAVPAFAAAELLRELAPDTATALQTVPYAPICVVCTGYRRDRVRHDMNGFGFLVPRNQGKRVLGSIWTSTIFPSQAPDGMILLRSMYGGATDPDAVNLSDNELLDAVSREIHPLLGIGAEPDFVRIYRHRRGIPQYVLTHGDVLDATVKAEQNHAGLAFAGNAYRGVGLNDCVVSAHRAVNMLR